MAKIIENNPSQYGLAISNISVLFSIYIGNHADQVTDAINSVLNQTLRPDQIVVVCDGPVHPDLDSMLRRWEEEHGALMTILRLPVNVGLGNALQEGLKNCRCELVARMDGDDISLPDRFEKQASFLHRHQEVGVLGGWIREFESDPNILGSVRTAPTGRDEVARYAKYRNPINHPSVMFRREIVLNAGGYITVHNFEDYYLWMRLLKQGVYIDNIPEIILKYRAGPSFYSRRGGRGYVEQEVRFQLELYRMGSIGAWHLFVNVLSRTFTRITPGFMRGFIYNNILRSAAPATEGEAY